MLVVTELLDGPIVGQREAQGNRVQKVDFIQRPSQDPAEMAGILLLAPLIRDVLEYEDQTLAVRPLVQERRQPYPAQDSPSPPVYALKFRLDL